MCIEFSFKPRFDYTHEGWILLWINISRKRKYIKLFKI